MALAIERHGMYRRWMRRLAIVLLLVLGAPNRRVDACSEDGSAKAMEAGAPDIFTWYDQATVVATVETTTAPGRSIEGHGLRGQVVMVVKKGLKGDPVKSLVFTQDFTACSGHTKGEKLIAFLGVKQQRLGFVGVDLVPVLAEWAAAKTPAAQQELLAKLAKSKSPAVAGAAKKRLAAKPSK